MQPAKTTDLTSPARRELPTRGRCNRASGNAGQQAGRLSYLVNGPPTAAPVEPPQPPREKSLATALPTALRPPPSALCPSHRTMASIFQSFPQLRTAAPRLARHLFVCRPCLNNPAARTFSARRTSSAPRLPSLLKQQARWKSTQPLRSNVAAAEASIAEAAAKGTAESTSKSKSKSSSWPETSSKSVAYWLLGSAASVFGIVIFGGLTRLTESG